MRLETPHLLENDLRSTLRFALILLAESASHDLDLVLTHFRHVLIGPQSARALCILQEAILQSCGIFNALTALWIG
jgi:hypothetical protein